MLTKLKIMYYKWTVKNIQKDLDDLYDIKNTHTDYQFGDMYFINMDIMECQRDMVRVKKILKLLEGE